MDRHTDKQIICKGRLMPLKINCCVQLVNYRLYIPGLSMWWLLWLWRWVRSADWLEGSNQLVGRKESADWKGSISWLTGRGSIKQLITMEESADWEEGINWLKWRNQLIGREYSWLKGRNQLFEMEEPAEYMEWIYQSYLAMI